MIVVFTGPTLPVAEAGEMLDALYLPPISQGDIVRAVERHPEAIGIIDGYFDQVPSVWHKEILWALDNGIPVYGSASMGALRAAELSTFGMVGIGRVFEAFQSGELEDDDEVAVRHGGAPDHRRLSEALVNIRETLAAAEAIGVIQRSTHRSLLAIAKSMFYADRSYAQLLREARRHALPEGDLSAFEAWLPSGTIDQKRLDAVAMLGAIAEGLGAPERRAPGFVFEHTTLWDQLRRSAGKLVGHQESSPMMVQQDLVIDELRLSADEWSRVQQVALLRRLATHDVQRRRVAITDDEIHESINKLRAHHDLETPADVLQWMADNDLSKADFLRLMQAQAAIDRAIDETQDDLGPELIDFAKLSGSYPELCRRARAKLPILAELDLMSPAAELYASAMAWYAVQREAAAGGGQHRQSMGCEASPAMMRAVLGEFLLSDRGGVL